MKSKAKLMLGLRQISHDEINCNGFIESQYYNLNLYASRNAVIEGFGCFEPNTSELQGILAKKISFQKSNGVYVPGKSSIKLSFDVPSWTRRPERYEPRKKDFTDRIMEEIDWNFLEPNIKDLDLIQRVSALLRFDLERFAVEMYALGLAGDYVYQKFCSRSEEVCTRRPPCFGASYLELLPDEEKEKIAKKKVYNQVMKQFGY